MGSEATWQRFYTRHAGGQCTITTAMYNALVDLDRVVETTLGGEPGKVVLLDLPFRLGAFVEALDLDHFRLHRIALREVRGWPPLLTGMESVAGFSSLTCVIRGLEMKQGYSWGPDRVEFDLEHGGHRFKASLVGCPEPLMQCVVRTLEQHGAVGSRLRNLEDLRLVGPE